MDREIAEKAFLKFFAKQLRPDSFLSELALDKVRLNENVKQYIRENVSLIDGALEHCSTSREAEEFFHAVLEEQLKNPAHREKYMDFLSQVRDQIYVSNAELSNFHAGKATATALGVVAIGAGIGYLWHRHQQRKHSNDHAATPWSERVSSPDQQASFPSR